MWENKLGGDPNGNGGSIQDYFLPYLEDGYNVVSIDYALSPDYLYPTPMYQITEAIQFLQKNGYRYGIGMDSIVFCGASDGDSLRGSL